MMFRYRLYVLLPVLLAAGAAVAQPVNSSPPEAKNPQYTSIMLAENMRRSGNLQEAAHLYRNLIMEEEGNVEARITLASIYRKTGQAKDAVAIMREAQKLEPDNEKVLAQLGYALIAAQEPEEAVGIFDMLTAINHESVEGYNGKAVAFDQAGNHTAAQELYQQALKIAPDSPTVLNNLALSMIMNNQPDMAVSILEPLSKQPGVPENVRHNLALAYGVKGDKRNAWETNLMSMEPEQAAANQEFYEHYAKLLKKQKVEALAPRMQAPLDPEEAEPVELSPAAAAPARRQATDIEPFRPVPVEPTAPAENNKPSISFWGSDAKAQYPTGRR